MPLETQYVYIPVDVFSTNSTHVVLKTNTGDSDFEAFCEEKKVVVFTPEELKPLEDIVNEGYDAYDSAHHLTVQRWLETIKNVLKTKQT